MVVFLYWLRAEPGICGPCASDVAKIRPFNNEKKMADGSFGEFYLAVILEVPEATGLKQ